MIMKNGNKLRIIGFVITLIGIILFVLGPILTFININNSPDEFPFMIILSFIGFPFIFVGSILAKIGSNQIHNFGINNFEIVKTVLCPFKESIAFAVSFKFALDVEVKRLIIAGTVDLD